MVALSGRCLDLVASRTEFHTRAHIAAIFLRLSRHPARFFSDLWIRVMRLICASCHRRWKLKPGAKRSGSCPGCEHEHRRSGQFRAWKLRRLRASPQAVPDAGARSAEDLARLIREADAASERPLLRCLRSQMARKRSEQRAYSRADSWKHIGSAPLR